MTDFVGSAMNESGVTMPQMQPLVDQLSASSGQLPGAGGGTVSGMISGMVVKGPVGGATVAAYAVENGTMGAQVGSAPTDPSGAFAVSVGSYAGPVVLQASGGTYQDEATGSAMPLLAGDLMAACLPSVAAGATTSGIQVTPLTSMAQARATNMPGGMTAANMTTANGAVGAYFSVGDILHVVPMNPAVAGSGAGATEDQRNYGMAIAAMSQYAQGIGMATSSSGMVTALERDASDGVMNGMMGSTAISMAGMGGMMGGTMSPTAGTSGLATAMSTFIGSPHNASGLSAADMQALMDQLAGSNGQLPGAGGGTTPFGTMSGTAFMGAMAGGTVTAYAVTDGMVGGQLGTSPLDASGAFHLSLGAYAGPVMLQMGGGTYADEATGATMSMLAGDVLTSCVPSVAAGSTTAGVQVTPLTSMAQARAQGMSGGMTAANISAANTAVGDYFMAGDILMTPPIDPAVAGSGSGATQGRKDQGMTIAAMSQYAHGLGMTTSSGIVTAMMKDASDGVMNGMMGSSPISMGGMGGMMGGMMQPTAGTSGLASAMTAFAGSAMNRSGVPLADVQPLVDKLAASNGTIR